MVIFSNILFTRPFSTASQSKESLFVKLQWYGFVEGLLNFEKISIITELREVYTPHVAVTLTF